MSATTVAQFRKQLVEIDRWLKDQMPKLHRSLQRPATDKQFAALSKEVFGGKPVPPLIRSWFQWHNGQNVDGDPFFPEYKESSFHLISISDAIRIRRDMRALQRYEELSGDWSESWLPLFEGEFGDCLVVEMAGKSQYAVRACWHELSAREIVAKHLSALLDRIRRDLRKQAKQQATDKADKLAEAPTPIPKSWVKGSEKRCPTVPDASRLDKDPVGTSYVVGPFEMPIFYPSKAFYVAVKLGLETWISVYDTSLDGALKSSEEVLVEQPKKKWIHANSKIAFELRCEAEIHKRKIRRRQVTLGS